jgi:WhiB family redox-sensing transcriptional regulator
MSLYSFLGGDLDEVRWMVDAACAGMDPEYFFPERNSSAELAKAICQSCPVAAQCLDFALNHAEDHGIWGGTNQKERRALRRARRAERTVA